MTDEPKRPKKRLGVIGMLLIAIAVVVVSTLGFVFTMCGGIRFTARAPVEKPLALAALTLPLVAARQGSGMARDWVRPVSVAVVVGAAVLAAAVWLA